PCARSSLVSLPRPAPPAVRIRRVARPALARAAGAPATNSRRRRPRPVLAVPRIRGPPPAAATSAAADVRGGTRPFHPGRPGRARAPALVDVLVGGAVVGARAPESPHVLSRWARVRARLSPHL